MLDGAIVIPLQSMIWNLLFQIGSLMWIVGRALLNVGYFIMSLTGYDRSIDTLPAVAGPRATFATP